MFLLDERSCETCRWWKRQGDSDTGVCTSVMNNDYASADIVYQSGADKGALFVTYAEFGCRDFAPRDGDAS